MDIIPKKVKIQAKKNASSHAKKLGKILKKKRVKNKILINHITLKADLKGHQIKSIESGTHHYTIGALIKYLSVVDPDRLKELMRPVENKVKNQQPNGQEKKKEAVKAR